MQKGRVAPAEEEPSRLEPAQTACDCQGVLVKASLDPLKCLVEMYQPTIICASNLLCRCFPHYATRFGGDGLKARSLTPTTLMYTALTQTQALHYLATHISRG